ncbi:MAG: response regulator [Deltaproteobacteria bacterium]|nr:response regulator [Deltaproteobacteria bacterium]
MKKRIANTFLFQWGMLGLALLVLGLIMAYNLYKSRVEVEAQERQRLLTQARVVAENLSLQLEATDQTLKTIRDDLAGLLADQKFPPEVNHQLKILDKAIPGIRTFLVTDQEGFIRLSNHDALLGLDVIPRDYFQWWRRNPKATGLFLSIPHKTRLSAWVMVLSRVISDKNGRFSGVVAAALDPEYFETLLGSVNYAPDMRTSIAHGEGLLFMAIPDRAGLAGKDLAQPGSFFTRHRASGKAAEVFTGTVFATGEKRMIAMRTIKPKDLPLNKPLYLAVGRDLAAITEGWRNDAQVQSGIFAVIALASILTLVFFQRRQRISYRQIELADARLRESAERLRLATEAAGLGIWEYDLASGRLTWDASMFDLYGIDPETFSATYDAWRNSVLPEDLVQAERAFSQAVAGVNNFDTEFRIRRGDGEVRTVRSIAQIRLDDVGQPVRMVGTNEDITERNLLENKIKQESARFQTLLKIASDGVHILDEEGNLREFSESFLNMLGYSAAEAARLNVADWDILFSPEGLTAKVHDVLRSPDIFETKHRRRDGTVIDVEINARGIELDGKDYLYASSRDITERKRMEERLADLLDLNSKIISNSTQGILAYHASGPCILANEAAAAIIGGTIPELKAQNFYQIPSWRESGMYDLAGLALKTNESRKSELHVTSSFGREVWLNCDLVPFSSGNEPHLLIIASDISAFRRSEELLRKAKDEADQANRAKSEFLANMSHEIRTPMNAIIGLTHLMRNTDLSSKQSDYLDKMRISSNALLGILNDILDYSKIEAGWLSLEEADFCLNDVLMNITDLFSVMIDEKKLELLFEVAPDLPECFRGDPLRFSQILNNLVGNAVKFTHQGEIHIKVEAAARTNGHILLAVSVRDTGIGIAEEYREKLFESFSQADGSTTRKYGGTGLGLTISKTLVELMGGEIKVESVLGGGSTFCFTARLKTIPEGQVRRDPRRLRRMKTLVADDHKTSRKILQHILAAWSFDVVTVDSGEEALLAISRAASEQRPFELLLLDWKMPGLDGLETARRLEVEVGRGRLPRPPVIIMVTAFGREHLLAAAGKTPLDAVLNKPITPPGVFDAIMRIQRRATPYRPFRSGDDHRFLPYRAESIQGMRLLLAEDNRINQQVARELLENIGFMVDIAVNGREAVDLAIRKNYDAVLMDIQMPEVDGFEATRRIRATGTKEDLPIIAMTAAATVQDKEKCLKAGMNDHVSKPIEPEKLVATLLKWIEPGKSAGISLVASSEAGAERTESSFEVAGFDLKRAVARMGGNWDALRRALRALAEESKHAVEKLNHLMDTKNYPELVGLAHSIKGAAGNLGAEALYQVAGQFEAEAKQGRATRREDFEEALTEIIQAIGTSCNQPEAENTGVDNFDLGCVERDINNLVSHLKKHLVVPPELMTDLHARLKCRLAESADRLVRQVDNFDYPGALTTVTAIAAALNLNLAGCGYDSEFNPGQT